ncbi:MAG: hypothetical protein KKA90_03690 [Nanoarchaeota archaeon]|nr:hypothetical protein [Nanoarchaeota archaeon]
MSELYVPRPVVGVASSFDGIINNAVDECAAVSFGAYDVLSPGKLKSIGLGRLAHPADLTPDHRDHRGYEAFRRLRPLVAKAGDYLPVVEIIHEEPGAIDRMLADPNNREAYQDAIQVYKTRLEAAKADGRWEKFGQKKVGVFYIERNRLKTLDEQAWNGMQSPMAQTVREFHTLVDAAEVTSDGKFIDGYAPFFASSKDPVSIFDLCLLYSREDRLETGMVGPGAQCVISRDRIYGNDVGEGDKVIQLSKVASTLRSSHDRIVRVDDRFDREEVDALRAAGFDHVVVMEGGYVFPWDLDEAREEGSGVTVLPREGFAQAFSDYAKAEGF